MINSYATHWHALNCPVAFSSSFTDLFRYLTLTHGQSIFVVLEFSNTCFNVKSWFDCDAMRFDSVKVDYAEPKHHQVEGEEGKSEEDIAVVL